MRKLEEVLQDWEAVIGLEVHAELTTLETKMFCGCKLEFGAAPNTHTCPVCLGLPGALPVPNKAAIESIVLAGLATNCDIEKHSMFYRKNYMYPDMSKNFQTTQGPVAFCMRGHLDLDVDGPAAKERIDGCDGLAEGDRDGNATRTADGYTAHVGITRIHMEEDAGKMVHVGGSEGRIAGATHSLVDYNRCRHAAHRAGHRARPAHARGSARCSCRSCARSTSRIGISDCSMEEGLLRCDGNVSPAPPRRFQELGVKTELKNMNSFKNLHDGLAYEICRQAEVLEEGGQIYQETRHWDPTSKRTIVMRVKETADDYRLFPEPDLAPYDLTDEWIDQVRAKLPELPDQKAARFARRRSGCPPTTRAIWWNSRATARFFEACMELAGEDAGALAKPVANLVINDVTAYLERPRGRQAGRHAAHACARRGAREAGGRGRHILQAGQGGVRGRPRGGQGPSGRRRGARHGAGVRRRRHRGRRGRGAGRQPGQGGAVPGRQDGPHRLLRGPVHEGDARPGQPEGDKRASGQEAGVGGRPAGTTTTAA